MLDPNNNGAVSLDELIYKASEEICKKIKATPEETEWDEYIKGWEELSKEELRRWENGEITLIRKWGEALFDIIDKDGNGSINLEEWSLYTKCAGVIKDEEDCKNTFRVCDRDGNGRITVDEMTRQHVGFWYTADPNSDGLYGRSVP